MYEYGLDVAGSCDCGLDWSAGVWYANPSDNEANDELNIYGEVSKDFSYFTAALGFIHYEFDDTIDADNTEAYGSLGAAFYGVDLGATLYWVVDGDTDANPAWGELSASYGYDISDKLSASLGLTWGFTVDADGGDHYNSYNAALSFDYAASENITVSPYVAYNGADGYNVDRIGVEDFDGIYGGVSVSFSF
ncbi:hypothetical protein [Roseibacillus ishigakijimensis]